MKNILVLSIFLVMLVFLCQSQEVVNLSPTKRLSQFPLKTWDMDKGLPTDMTIRIMQDTTGYLWLATYKGITRFDGQNFSVYNHTTSEVIKSITIQDLAKDNKGNLWFGTQQGLVRYANYEFYLDESLSPLGDISVERVYFDPSENAMWFGTTSEGVFRYDFSKLEPMPAFLHITRSVVKAISGDNNGNIWIGTEGGEVVKFDGKTFSNISSNKIMGGIGSFYFSQSSSTLWVATEYGIFRYIDDELIHQDQIPVESVNVVVEDNHKSLWIGTNSGLYRFYFDSGIIDSMDENMGIPNNLIRDIMADSQGNIWVATYRKGFFNLTDGLITNYSVSEGLANDIIISIVQIDNDKFYIADEYGYINVLEGESITNLNIKTDITSSRLKSMFVDSKQNLWVSTYGGLLKIEPSGKEILFNFKSGFPTETIRLIFEDSRGNLWVGTRSIGLLRISENGEVLEEYDRTKGISSNYIMDVTEDKLGRIIVATKNGINIIENNKVVKILDMDSGLPSNFAFNVHIDDNNVFWVASNDGIIRIENDREVFVFNIENGMFDNNIFDILEDDFGFFWMPSDLGIARVPKNELNQFAKGVIDNYSYRIFGRSDGMKNSRCMGATKSLNATDGRLFFNTSGGVSIVNPLNVVDESTTSKPLIEKMMVNREAFMPSQQFVVPPGNRRIQLHYTAFNFKEPEKIRFRYQLVPFDENWVEAESDRVARYTNVPPGSYTFRVQATNQEGIWLDNAAEVNVHVKTSWWQTWWFRVLLAMAFSFLLFGVYKARTYTVKKQKRELEKIVEARTAQIAEQKKELENQSKELEKLSIVARHTNNAILMTSPSGDIIWVNDSFKRIYGYTLDEFITIRGRNLPQMCDDPKVRSIIEKCINEKIPVSYTIEVTTKDGKPLWIQTDLTPIKNDDGTVRVIVAIDTNITQLKQAESDMMQMNHEIISQAESILQQNEEIQTQRDELEQINNLLIKHTQNIESSIWYAHTIQKATLPSPKTIDKFFENFIVFKPRDIVSGDFYWFHQLSEEMIFPRKFIVAVVDCTGHGVPGALMSMIGSRLLSEIVTERQIIEPASILSELNKLVNIVLKQDTEENIDGMDLAITLIEQNKEENTKVTFSGANRPLYVLKNGDDAVQTIKGNRKTIGGIMPDIDAEFKNHTIQLEEGDMIIMNTDGYTDQNGDDGKKVTAVKFHNILCKLSNKTMPEIGEDLDVFFDEFRGTQPQRDDATVLGLKF